MYKNRRQQLEQEIMTDERLQRGALAGNPIFVARYHASGVVVEGDSDLVIGLAVEY